MKFTAPLITGCLFLCSCATVLTKKNYNFNINYAQEGTKIRYKDSVYSQPSSIRVRRSKERLVFTAFNDSISRRYEVKPRLNPIFLWGDMGSLLLYPVAPIVYGIDLTNSKRFHYGSGLKVKLDDTLTVATRPTIDGNFPEGERMPGPGELLRKHFGEQLTHQGDLYWSASWPLILYNASYPGVGRKTAVGGIAISSGFEYYYRDRRALGINAGISTTPVQLAETETPDGPTDPEEHFSALYIDLYHKHTIKRFSFAYGPNYTYNTWKNTRPESNITPPDLKDERATNHSFGIMVSGYYQLHPYFKFGVVYRPTLLRVYPDVTGIYQHTISFDLAVTLKVKPKK